MMNKAQSYSSPILTKLAINAPIKTVENVSKQMALAVRIDDAVKAKGWSKKEFANQMGKKPPEISRWLSGCHNFTTDTLWKIEEVLDIRLIMLQTA
jgi:ribosome-binding protein aMBF1 (putative translation factor)